MWFSLLKEELRRNIGLLQAEVQKKDGMFLFFTTRLELLFYHTPWLTQKESICFLLSIFY